MRIVQLVWTLFPTRNRPIVVSRISKTHFISWQSSTARFVYNSRHRGHLFPISSSIYLYLWIGCRHKNQAYKLTSKRELQLANCSQHFFSIEQTGIFQDSCIVKLSRALSFSLLIIHGMMDSWKTRPYDSKSVILIHSFSFCFFCRPREINLQTLGPLFFIPYVTE